MFNSSQGAIREVAGQNLTANFCLSGSVTSSMSVGQKASCVIGALDQSRQGLEAIRDAKSALAEQLDGNVMNTPSSMNASNGLGMRSMAASAAIGLALTAVNPVAGAAYMAIDALRSGIGGHAGIGHAAIDGGKSDFSSPLSRNKDGSYEYTDISGDTYSGGLLNTGYAASKAGTPQNAPAPNPAQQLMARDAIDRLGEDEIRQQIASVGQDEKLLMKQADTAIRFAKSEWGITAGPDGKPDKPDHPKFGMDKPDWVVAKTPMFSAPAMG
ncbi:MAG: hypothetical protein RBR86_07200 [Pseudobdellovibrionaceae bacterium]|jgi:hypothetical protein|nr:hypothetical protein [Pseudobdellovibrionaceae bacterium]